MVALVTSTSTNIKPFARADYIDKKNNNNANKMILTTRHEN